MFQRILKNENIAGYGCFKSFIWRVSWKMYFIYIMHFFKSRKRGFLSMEEYGHFLKKVSFEKKTRRFNCSKFVSIHKWFIFCTDFQSKTFFSNLLRKNILNIANWPPSCNTIIIIIIPRRKDGGGYRNSLRLSVLPFFRPSIPPVHKNDNSTCIFFSYCPTNLIFVQSITLKAFET
jgi:hypothetical protein